MSLFYKIWVDLIVRLRSQPQHKHSWKVPAMVFMTMAMMFNLALFMSILQRNIIGKYFYKLEVDFLPDRISNFISFVTLFILPPIILNYLLIFHNDRYEKLIKKYPYYNGKLFLAYFIPSMLLPIVLIWIGIIFFR